MKSWPFVMGIGLAVVAACSSSSTPSSTPVDAGSNEGGSSSGSSTGSCRLTVYPSDYPARCQAELDRLCCSEERACADDLACAKVFDCIAKCPVPRKDACINACAPGGTAPPGFDAIGSCSKNSDFDPDGGTECSYP